MPQVKSRYVRPEMLSFNQEPFAHSVAIFVCGTMTNNKCTHAALAKREEGAGRGTQTATRHHPPPTMRDDAGAKWFSYAFATCSPVNACNIFVVCKERAANCGLVAACARRKAGTAWRNIVGEAATGNLGGDLVTCPPIPNPHVFFRAVSGGAVIAAICSFAMDVTLCWHVSESRTRHASRCLCDGWCGWRLGFCGLFAYALDRFSVHRVAFHGYLMCYMRVLCLCVVDAAGTSGKRGLISDSDSDDAKEARTNVRMTVDETAKALLDTNAMLNEHETGQWPVEEKHVRERPLWMIYEDMRARRRKAAADQGRRRQRRVVR